MNQDHLRELFENVRDGRTTPEEAAKRLDHLPFEDLGFAKVDHHRALRHGMPEVILGRGKTADEVRRISEKLLERSPNLLVTRADAEMYEVVKELDDEAEYFPRSGCLRSGATSRFAARRRSP